MEDTTREVICEVCGGRGGWKIERKTPLGENWLDCLFCQGLGFYTKTIPYEIPASLQCESYKAKILERFTAFGTIDACTLDEKGETLHIDLVPSVKFQLYWGDFIKTILKFGYLSETLDIQTAENFFYVHRDKYRFSWRISITPHEWKDLEGFIEFIDNWKGGEI